MLLINKNFLNFNRCFYSARKIKFTPLRLYNVTFFMNLLFTGSLVWTITPFLRDWKVHLGTTKFLQFLVFLFFNFLFYLITFVNIVSTVWPWQPHDKRGKVSCYKNNHSYQCLDKVLSSVCQYESKSLCLLTFFLIPIGFFWNFAWSWCILLVKKWQNGIFQKNNSSKIGFQGLIVWCVLFLP